MCENFKGPPESRACQADWQRSTSEPDTTLFNGESPVQISERTRALHCNAWEAFLDKDGRLVNESALRKAVFKGKQYMVTVYSMNVHVDVFTWDIHVIQIYMYFIHNSQEYSRTFVH